MIALRLSIAVTLLVMAISPALAQTFADGLAAYDAGDYEQTVRIWRPLAERGDPRAQVALAGLYRSGEGVPRDITEAARLYRMAALQGDDDAQLNLGRLYADGSGVSPDLVQAYVWLSLAAEQGRRWAKTRRQEIEAELSAEQRSEAEAEIQRLRP